MGLLSVKSSAPAPAAAQSYTDILSRACRTADGKKGAASAAALTQPRFSTATKTVKTVKKQGKASSIGTTETVSAFGCRKDSKKFLLKEGTPSEDAISNRSGKTHIIDEVLH